MSEIICAAISATSQGISTERIRAELFVLVMSGLLYRPVGEKVAKEST
jgi:hypothetical protein